MTPSPHMAPHLDPESASSGQGLSPRMAPDGHFQANSASLGRSPPAWRLLIATALAAAGHWM